ncbi:hypothetical protein HZS_4297 [Henneguya salminicola]|nr:hypothetical protein HZS_4297 [Henneguya salminicola]
MKETEDTIVDQYEKIKEETIVEKPKSESDVYNFLKSLKLDYYIDLFIDNGADKLGQLIYVEDSVIDQLCAATSMKIIHAGVFKKAIKECKLSARLNINAEHSDRAQLALKFEQGNSYTAHYNSQHQDASYNMVDRRRYVFNPEHGQMYPSNPVGNLSMVAPCPNPESYNYYTRPYSYGNHLENSIVNPRNFAIEDSSRPENDRSNAVQDYQTQASPKSSEHHGSPVQTLPDGGFYVVIGDRSVKFPSTVKHLTVIERIDQDRRDIVRKGSQIYGRDDTKRKHNELTPLEVFMNEIAYEICLRDFTYMISRQKLLGLVREIVKDNQIQLSGHHSYSSINSYMCNGKAKQDKSKVNSFVEGNNETVTVNAADQGPPLSDYDIILYHKLNREWPLGLTKERRKYLGRRSSNFEAINNVLYYSKDQKKRKWVFEDEEIEEVFTKCHIDPETNVHYSREATFERLTLNYYFRNMSNITTDLFLKCSTCKERFNLQSEDSTTNTRSKGRHVYNNDVKVMSVQASEPIPDLRPLGAVESSAGKRKLPELDITTEIVPAVKKSRKSVPHKLVIENSDYTVVQDEPQQDNQQNLNGNVFLDISNAKTTEEFISPENETSIPFQSSFVAE